MYHVIVFDSMIYQLLTSSEPWILALTVAQKMTGRSDMCEMSRSMCDLIYKERRLTIHRITARHSSCEPAQCAASVSRSSIIDVRRLQLNGNLYVPSTEGSCTLNDAVMVCLHAWWPVSQTAQPQPCRGTVPCQYASGARGQT